MLNKELLPCIYVVSGRLSAIHGDKKCLPLTFSVSIGIIARKRSSINETTRPRTGLPDKGDP